MKAWKCINRNGACLNGLFQARTKGEAKAMIRAKFGEKPGGKPGSRKRLPVGYRVMRA